MPLNGVEDGALLPTASEELAAVLPAAWPRWMTSRCAWSMCSLDAIVGAAARGCGVGST